MFPVGGRAVGSHGNASTFHTDREREAGKVGEGGKEGGRQGRERGRGGREEGREEGREGGKGEGQGGVGGE